jgi:UDP-glucose 4-epimerase
MKKILITGGAGYIGSKIVADLIKQKYKVYVVDNLSTGYKMLINKKAIFLKSNIGNKKKINNFLKENKISSIIHCAASLDISESQKRPEKYFINNYVNTKKLLDVCVANGLKNFIFSSTAAVYGNVSGKISELKKTRPVSVYGKTKLLCEKTITSYSKKFHFNYGILRYFNVAGSDMINKIGCINHNNQLFKNLSISITNGNNSAYIYGNDYNTKDGTCVRDYIHLEDLSKVHCKLLKIIMKNNRSYVLNCGYGRGYSVMEVIRNYEKIYKLKLKKIFLPRRKREVVKIFSNTNKIDRVLKLQLNKKNKLRQIIKSSVLWEKFLNAR